MRIALTVCLSAIVMATAASSASASLVISTPTGLNPGDHFRIMFVTTGTIDATSINISTYDTFVNTDANGATYNGSVISWKAIGSTISVNAITHIGTTGSAVYLAGGTKVTSSDDLSGLWSGTLLNAPDQYLSGASVGGVIVYTGTNTDGTAYSGYEFGNSTESLFGISMSTNSDWVANDFDNNENAHHLYGISSDLVVPSGSVVPEPSTAVLAGLGALAGLIYSLARKRKP